MLSLRACASWLRGNKACVCHPIGQVTGAELNRLQELQAQADAERSRAARASEESQAAERTQREQQKGDIQAAVSAAVATALAEVEAGKAGRGAEAAAAEETLRLLNEKLVLRGEKGGGWEKERAALVGRVEEERVGKEGALARVMQLEEEVARIAAADIEGKEERERQETAVKMLLESHAGSLTPS